MNKDNQWWVTTRGLLWATRTHRTWALEMQL